MKNEPATAPSEEISANRTRTYLGVIAVEVLVVLGLWLFGVYFSS